jgi:hypothetical protein
MNDRQRRIYDLKDEYCDRLAEGHNKKEFTSFDLDVISALDKLFDAHRDVAVPPECASLGFVLKSESKPEYSGCLTVPCLGGKMPYQEEPRIACSNIYGVVCGLSPMRAVWGRRQAGDER